MRPKVDYKVKNRLVEVARDVDDGLPEDRDVGFQEALTSVLDHVEADSSESVEQLGEGFVVGDTGQQQQSDPFGGVGSQTGSDGWM